MSLGNLGNSLLFGEDEGKGAWLLVGKSGVAAAACVGKRPLTLCFDIFSLYYHDDV